MNYWKFLPTKIIEDFSFNSVLKRFFSQGVSGLVRENIQNSLDARIDKSSPVIVKIKLGKISKNDIPGFNEIQDHVQSLRGGNEYSNETIMNMKEHLNENYFEYISFEDENTKGLSGSKNGYDDSTNSSYSAYAYARGLHIQDTNDVQEMGRGGSHGIGKIASNSASIFYTMFFSNCDEFNYQTLGGSIQLIDHELNGEKFRATGYFTDDVDNHWMPYENKNYHEVFKKTTRGLKIIVPFLHPIFNNRDEIIRTLIDSFLLGIKKQDIIIDFESKIINHETYIDYINSSLFDNNFLDSSFFTREYQETFNVKREFIQIADLYTSYNFDLYIRYDELIKKGRTGVFRSIGMKIEDYKVNGYVNAPYNAILIPVDHDGDKFLKSLENESHTKIDYTHISQIETLKNAKKFIQNLNSELGKIIYELINKNNQTEGKFDVSDILYEINKQFEHDIKKRVSEINLGQGDEKKRLIKVTETDEPGLSSRKKKNHGGGGDKVKLVKKILDGDSYSYYYTLPNSIIKRFQDKVNENILIDLSNIDNIEIFDKANLYVTLVDGTGAEHLGEYDLIKSYDFVLDSKTGEKLEIKKNGIIGVKFTNKTARLKLRKNTQTSKFAKLKFYLEV